MLYIPIDSLPNQSLTITLDGNVYNITIKETNGCMSIDIERNGTIILQGMRLVANTGIIPYQYLENGNFAIETKDQELPYYTKFNDTQFLIFASSAELESIRAGV